MSVDYTRKDMLDTMDTLSGEIIHIEAMADELTKAAVALSEHQPGAEAIRDAAMRKRVRAIELRGQLAASRERYTIRFHVES